MDIKVIDDGIQLFFDTIEDAYNYCLQWLSDIEDLEGSITPVILVNDKEYYWDLYTCEEVYFDTGII